MNKILSPKPIKKVDISKLEKSSYQPLVIDNPPIIHQPTKIPPSSFKDKIKSWFCCINNE